jgi:hypothetical protein
MSPIKKCICSCALLALLASFGAGCSSTGNRLNRLELGMTTAQVKKILGEDYVVKASNTGAKGETLTMWEYRDEDTEEAFRLYFKDGMLAQWGTAATVNFPELKLPNRQN